MKLADKIKHKLMRGVRGGGYEIIIPNFFYGFYEMDLFRLMPSGIVVEYEIKISRADFKNDFNKDYNKKYGNHEGITNKHQLIRTGKGNCNRFFFVVPDNLIHVNECPEYCGLIYVSESGYLNTVKNAPLLHKTKAFEANKDIYKELAGRLAFREDVLQSKITSLKRKLKREH